MKKPLLIILLLLPFSLFAQEKISYSSKGGDIEFTISTDEYYVAFSNANWQQTLQGIAPTQTIAIGNNAAVITISLPGADYETRKTVLTQSLKKILQKTEPILIYKDGTRQICTGEIIVKFTDTAYIDTLSKLYEIAVTPDKFVSKQYIISLNGFSTQQVFTLLNQLKANKHIEFAEPNFIRLLKTYTSDPYYSSQWAIKNQGYLGGTSGADMHVEDAWNIATGTGIKVAIIDEGVDLSHPDLAANLLNGYDATGNGSGGAPNSTNDDAHGTGCAGIVAAVANNSIGVAGVAYNAKIIPVRIAYTNGYPLGSPYRTWITSDSWIANGITWAKNDGADILSNSWGGGSASSTVTNAINDAISNGRSGKGCVVLFATGNDNASSITYPSSLSNVIAVGASSMCDERKSFTSCDGEYWWGGNYGTGLDVMAPGVQIYTTDISGTAGYNSGDYQSDFNGTSSATPNTAGVVALILSVNPNLTAQQARNVLETTCDKVGGYTYQSNVSGQPNGTWSTDAGYGRINACAAVSAALSTLSISGDNTVCTTSSNYSIPNLPTGATVTWSASPLGIATINSPNSTQTTLTKNNNGSITLTATIANACGAGNIVINKQIGVGYTQILNIGYPSSTVAPDELIPMQIFIAPDSFVIGNQKLVITRMGGGYTNTLYTGGDGAVEFSFPMTGTYNIKVYTYNDCGWSTNFYPLVFFCTNDEMFMLSPNPATTSLTMKLSDETVQSENVKSNGIGIKEIQLTDKMGNVLKRYVYSGTDKQVTIDVSILKADIYYIKLFNGKQWQVKSFIKQ
jgi:subtilisin family serine protease